MLLWLLLLLLLLLLSLSLLSVLESGGPYCGRRPGDIATALHGNVWKNNGTVLQLKPLDQASVNQYWLSAMQGTQVRECAQRDRDIYIDR